MTNVYQVEVMNPQGVKTVKYEFDVEPETILFVIMRLKQRNRYGLKKMIYRWKVKGSPTWKYENEEDRAFGDTRK